MKDSYPCQCNHIKKWHNIIGITEGCRICFANYNRKNIYDYHKAVAIHHTFKADNLKYLESLACK
jgi:hypothetical protein